MAMPVVKVKQGSLKGGVVESEFGKFVSFNGIPYAEPPIGKLRFKDPQPPKPWDGVREAITEGGVAPQIHFLSMTFIGEDDCLYLNVSTKDLSGKKPVMVWIHGGGFTVGSGNSDLYRPDYLVQHDIVFVSINYRVGMLGFLNMGMGNCSGNQGLKDQVFALKWVQENIEAFGGDKNNVTIFGESAGSASVHYLSISPLAKGLFHKAIAQSGVSINPWAFQDSNKDRALKIAAVLGNSSTNDEEIVNFLQTIPAEKIIETTRKIFNNNVMKLEFLFVPTIDDACSHPFLPKPLNEMIKNGINVPLIMGYNSHEGIIALGDPDVDVMYKKLNENFDECLSTDLNVHPNVVSKFSKDVKDFYFKKSPITKENEDALIQYKGDVFFVNGIIHILENQLKGKTPTYFYKYSHCPEASLIKVAFKVDAKGACHADELNHLFYKTAFPASMQLQKGTKDYLIMQRMTKMWTDFAKTGDPTPETDGNKDTKWSPYNVDQRSCLHITENVTIADNFEEESWKLWKPIFEEYELF